MFKPEDVGKQVISREFGTGVINSWDDEATKYPIFVRYFSGVSEWYTKEGYCTVDYPDSFTDIFLTNSKHNNKKGSKDARRVVAMLARNYLASKRHHKLILSLTSMIMWEHTYRIYKDAKKLLGEINE